MSQETSFQTFDEWFKERHGGKSFRQWYLGSYITVDEFMLELGEVMQQYVTESFQALLGEQNG